MDNVKSDFLPFPKEAIREAVYNAIAHKFYGALTPIQISVYPDKIYIANDCIFPEDWTIDDLRKGMLIQTGYGRGMIYKKNRNFLVGTQDGTQDGTQENNKSTNALSDIKLQEMIRKLIREGFRVNAAFILLAGGWIYE